MSQPNETLLTPEGLASYEKILEDDQFSMPDGKIPVMFTPKMDREGRYQHDILFNVLNKQINEFDPEAPKYDPSLVGTTKVENVNDGYTNIYRAVLSDIGAQDPMFNNLAPTLRKRLIDDYAIRLNGMHHHFIDNMPSDLKDNEKDELAKTYNDYMQTVMLPNISKSLNHYGHEQSINASGNNNWKALGTAFANMMEGAATQLRDDTNVINTEDYADWFQGVSDYVKGRVDKLDPKTGTMTLSPEESMRDVGGWSKGPLDIPTFKDGYLYHTVVEGLMQQIVTSGLPMAGAYIGGGLGLGAGGPVGGLVGAGIGATLFSLPGHLVETGSFKDELKTQWEETKEQAKWYKENNILSPEDYAKKFTIDLGTGDQELKVLAHELTDDMIEDMSDNMAQLYALHSTAIEILSSVGGAGVGWGVNKGMTAMGKKWASSKLGQRVMANNAMKIISKPMSALPLMTTEAIQEGWTERTQEGINISMMNEVLPDFKKVTGEQEEARLNQATFIGAVIGGKFSAAGQVVQSYRNWKEDLRILDADKEADAQRFGEIQTLKQEMMEQQKSGKTLYQNDIDLAVQIGMIADADLNEQITANIIRNVSDDLNQIGRYHEARSRVSMSSIKRKKLNNRLLNTKKGKAMIKSLGLSAQDFVHEMTLKDFEKTFGKEAETVLDKLADEIDLEKRKEKEAEFSADYTDDSQSIHNGDGIETKVTEEKDKVLKNKQAKLQTKIKALVAKRKKNKGKLSKKDTTELKSLSKRFNALTKKIKDRQYTRDSSKSDGKGKKNVSENTPTAITELLQPFKWQSKTPEKREFFKAIKKKIQLRLDVVGTGSKKNKDGQLEDYYTVQIISSDPNYQVQNTGTFDVFDSEINKAWNKNLKKSFKPKWKEKPKDTKSKNKLWTSEVDIEVPKGTKLNNDIPPISRIIGGVKYNYPKGIGFDQSLLPEQAKKDLKAEEKIEADRTRAENLRQLKDTFDAESQFQGVTSKPSKFFETEQQIEDVGNSFKNKNFKKVYGIIKNFIPKNLSVRVDRRTKVPASFNRETNTITFNPKLIESQDQLEYSLLHELAHSGSAKVIQDYFDGNLKEGSSQFQAVEELDTLFNVIKGQLTQSEKQGILELNKFIEKLKKDGLTVQEREIAKSLRKKFYGFTNLKEFVSELMVNEEFQQSLEKIKFTQDNRSVLRKFFDILAKVLVGADTVNLEDTDALMVAFRSSFNVMNVQAEINKDKNVTFRKPLKSPSANVELQTGPPLDEGGKDNWKSLYASLFQDGFLEIGQLNIGYAEYIPAFKDVIPKRDKFVQLSIKVTEFVDEETGGFKTGLPNAQQKLVDEYFRLNDEIANDVSDILNPYLAEEGYSELDFEDKDNEPSAKDDLYMAVHIINVMQSDDPAGNLRKIVKSGMEGGAIADLERLLKNPLYKKDMGGMLESAIEILKDSKIGTTVRVKKIISGGQIGADQVGLEVGRKLGLKTGGTAPPGFQTSIGSQKTKLKEFGLVEGEKDSNIYPKRTRKNIENSDGTVVFSDNLESRGTSLTIGHAKAKKKPLIVNPTADELSTWLSENDIEVLNVAGNQRAPAQMREVLETALSKKAPPSFYTTPSSNKLIKAVDSQQKARQQVKENVKKKVKKVGKVVVTGATPDQMRQQALKTEEELDAYLEGKFDDSGEVLGPDGIDDLANNIHQDVTHYDDEVTEDYEQYYGDEEDFDIGLIDWSKKAIGLLTPSSQKRAEKAFAYGFHQLIRKFNLPLSYWEDYKRQMSESLEGTLLSKAFDTWASNYEINLETHLDKIGVYAPQDWEIQFSKDFNDGALSDIADTMQDAWDATEEFLRQGIGLTETGKIESDTKTNNFYKMDNHFFSAIGVTPTTSNSKAFYDLAIKSKTPEAFLLAISEDSFIKKNKTYSDSNQTPAEIIGKSGTNRMILVRFWNSQQQINRTPTNRGRQQKGAVRSLFGIFSRPKYDENGNIIRQAWWKLNFKGRENKNSNWIVRNKDSKWKKFQKIYKNLPNKMRSRAVEKLFETEKGNDLVYMSLSDMWKWNVPDKVVNQDGETENHFSVRKDAHHGEQGFFALIRASVSQGLAPLFTRGDGKLIPMVKITQQHKEWSGNVSAYWDRELSSVPDQFKSDIKRKWIMGYIAHFNLDEIREVFPPNSKGKITDSVKSFNTVQIARHEAYKKIYGDDYWVHMTPHNMIHRAKIPFSEGTRSELMPDKKIVTFDTRIDLGADSKAKMTKVMEDGSTVELDLVQKIDNKWQYRWDGSTWTSEINFVNDYHKLLGTNKKARRAKTSFYVGGNEGAFLQKHQEFAFFMEDGVAEVQITDGNGDFVATIKKDESGFVNIYDKNNEFIDYLGTPDETKAMTGKFANQYNETITLPGTAITMIQYARDNDKSHAKFFTQLLNYFPDSEFQNLVMDYWNDNDVKRKRSPVQSLNLLNEVVKNPAEMDQFKIGYVRATIDGLPLAIARNAMSGVGFHPSDAGTNENVVKNGIVRTAIDFLGYGSKLDFRMDAMGDLNDNEIILPYDHKISRNITKIMKAKGVTGEISKADINKWLEDNPIEVLAVRSPVPSRFGYRVMRVKRLENIGDTFIVNSKIVKQVFEGDGDGDTASIQFLTGRHKKLMKWLKDHQELTGGLGLEASGQEIDLSTLTGLANAMYNMSLGKNAVAQIGNMAKVSGVLNTWFERLEIDGRVIKMRKMQDTYYDPDMEKTVSMENLYRMYMQAAADHAKLLLLGPENWNYSRQKLYSALFYYEDNPNEVLTDDHYFFIAKKILKPTTKGLSVIGGKFSGEEMSFKDHFEFGKEYSEFMESRGDMILESEPNMEAPDYVIESRVKEYLESLGLTIADLGEDASAYFEEARELIEGAPVEARLFGKVGPQHALETISTSIYDAGIQNGWDGDVFRTPFAKTIALHQTVLGELSEKWNQEIVLDLMIESGMTQKQIDKMKIADRDLWVKQNLMPLISQAQKFAQGLSTELRNAIKDIEEDDVEAIDNTFSSNQYQMNDRENAVIEGWIARLSQNEFTSAQRKLFTWSYLQDVTDSSRIKGAGSLRLHIAFPPTDPINPINSLLHPEMMNEFYLNWNQLNKDSDFVTPNQEDIGVMRKTTSYLKEEFERRGCVV